MLAVGSVEIKFPYSIATNIKEVRHMKDIQVDVTPNLQ